MTRRQFLKASLAGCAALGCIDLEACGLAPSSVAFAELAADGRIHLPFADYPDLNAPTRAALTLRIANDVQDDMVVAQAADGSWLAVDSSCTHERCPVAFSVALDCFECPCHGARFDKSGAVVKGPALAPLTSYAVEASESGLQIVVNEGALEASVGGTLVIALADYPALMQTGGSVKVRPRGLGDTLIVARIDAEAFAVTSAICTHLQCKVGYDAEASQMLCPCHGSRFELDGTVLNGPATKNLKAYEARLDGEQIIISLPQV